MELYFSDLILTILLTFFQMSGEPPNTDLKKTKEREHVAGVISRFFCGSLKFMQKLMNRLINVRIHFEKSQFFKHHEVKKEKAIRCLS